MNIFFFMGKWYRRRLKQIRGRTTIAVTVIRPQELEALFQAIHDSYETNNLTDLDNIQNAFSKVTNG